MLPPPRQRIHRQRTHLPHPTLFLLVSPLLLPPVVATDGTAALLSLLTAGVGTATDTATSTTDASEAPAAETTTDTAVSTDTATATATSTAAFATSTTSMSSYSDSEDVVILASSSSIVYACPDDGAEWTSVDMTDELSGMVASGAGCTAELTFTGDSIQVYGGTGVDAGVFGCSVDISTTKQETDWWNGVGETNYFVPYAGSCRLAGLGYGKHTIQFVNSPYQPGYAYLTGFHYTTNKTSPVWADLTWEACCVEYDFPDDVATFVSTSVSGTSTASTRTDAASTKASATSDGTDSTAASSASTSGSDDSDEIAGFSTGTFLWMLFTAFVCIVLASLLVGCLCCRKRPASGKTSTSSLAAALRGSDSASRPLRRKRSHHKSSKHDDDTPSTESDVSDTESDGELSEDDESDAEKGSAHKRR